MRPVGSGMVNNLKIRTKLIGGLSALVVTVAGANLLSAQLFSNMEKADEILYHGYTAPLADLSQISGSLENVRVVIRELIRSTDRAAVDEKWAVIRKDASNLEAAAARFEKDIQTEEGRKLFADFQRGWKGYFEVIDQVHQHASRNALAEAQSTFERAHPFRQEIQAALVALNDAKVDGAKKLSDANVAAAAMAKRTLWGATIFTLLLAFSVAFMLQRAIVPPLKQMTEVARRVAQGDVKVAVDYQSADEMGELADSFRASVDYLKGAAEAAAGIGRGDLNVQVQPKGPEDILANNLLVALDALRKMVAEAQRLSQAAVAGQLSSRADTSQYQGAYRNVVSGVNDTLDAVIGPLNMAAGYIDKISKGEIPAKITEAYHGDFNLLKNNLNQCIEAVNGMIRDAQMLAQAALEGRLSTRADASRHQGDFRRIVEGVNNTLDAVIGPLNMAASYVDKISKGEIPTKIVANYNGDFNLIKNNLNQCIEAVNRMISDTQLLSKAAVEGKLSTRADASKHQGDFRAIVDGVNQTLDAVVAPMNEASAVLKRVAGGDLTAEVRGDYRGDHAAIKENINKMTSDLRSSMRQIGANAEGLGAAAEEMSAVSTQLGSTAEETSAQANAVSAAAEQVNRNVQTVASGADEMSASIKEIAKNTAEATRIAQQAVRQADVTTQLVSRLGVSSGEIGQVIKVITSIAQQTNLLALNATIEAARAGEAGKGFAVVANEVKELAKETARATEEIGQKIEAIQADTQGAVSAISEISGVIQRFDGISATIASAIEEQAATTNEIARNVSEAARGAADIAQNITGVASAAESTTGAAGNTQQSSGELSRMASELQRLLAQFKVDESIVGRAVPKMARMVPGTRDLH